MIINIVDKQTKVPLPLISQETSIDGHIILSVTCGYGTLPTEWKTYSCMNADKTNIMPDKELPFTVEIQESDMLGLIGG